MDEELLVQWSIRKFYPWYLGACPNCIKDLCPGCSSTDASQCFLIVAKDATTLCIIGFTFALLHRSEITRNITNECQKVMSYIPMTYLGMAATTPCAKKERHQVFVILISFQNLFTFRLWPQFCTDVCQIWNTAVRNILKKEIGAFPWTSVRKVRWWNFTPFCTR